MNEWFGQAGFEVRHEWGRDGARKAAARGDVLAIVDVLRFTTTVAAAVAKGYLVCPCRRLHEAPAKIEMFADRTVDRSGDFTLSPLGFAGQAEVENMPIVALASPNGATCSLMTSASLTIAGALVNATIVGRYLTKCVMDSVPVTVVSCGERWEESGEDGPLRFAIEDYVGAGAIIAAIESGSKSPEALACQGAFLAVKERLTETLEACGSGVELAAKGRLDDVRFAARPDSIPVIPALVAGVYYPWAGDWPL
jgi:2-phosphosulfolactate phosphatase